MPEPGDTIDRFVVEERLGQGGMATVYKVRHTSLGSVHALKVLDLRFESVKKRLLLEGQVQARLAHPNIVAVTDLVQVEGAPGLILEYVAGPPLNVWLRDHRPDPATCDTLFRGILDAVVHAHRHDLVHRDLKPGNVLLYEIEGRLVPKVADFGLTKLLTDDGEARARTRTGLAMGTPGYMAPEQIRSAKDVDRRADVFALGCILYELWCGGPAFHGDSVFEVLTAIEDRRFTAPRELCPDLPARIEDAILKCLEPEPDRRLDSAEALRALLYPDAPVTAAPRADSSAKPIFAPQRAPAAATTPPPTGPRAASTVEPLIGAPSTFSPPGPPPFRPAQRGQMSAASTGLLVITVVVLGLTVAGGMSLTLLVMAAMLGMVGALDPE